MKKLIASAGMVAVGSTTLQAAYAPGLSPQEMAKPLTVSAALRGFYDDNYVTAPGGLAKSSFGVDFRPSVAYNRPMEQTFLRASYDYSLKYYADRKGKATDHSHELELLVDHKFSQRYRAKFTDSFAFSQEPEVIGDLGAPIRTESDVVRNHANLDFTALLTELVALEAGYRNSYFDYLQSGDGSRSAVLDRLEHLFHVDARWQMREHLLTLVGYQVGIVDYTSKEFLVNSVLGSDVNAVAASLGFPPPYGNNQVVSLAQLRSDLMAAGLPTSLINQFVLTGDARDSISHYFYLGGEIALTSQLSVGARVGVQYTDFDQLNSTSFNPYADVRGMYTYLPGSYVQFGIRHQRSATDLAGTGTRGGVTLDAEATAIYASIAHRITAHITGNLLGQYHRSSFKGGTLDSVVDNLYFLGISADYRINKNWGVEAGYNFDRLDSEVAGRSFSRNRVYLGARAIY
jgi:hypothetical protein